MSKNKGNNASKKAPTPTGNKAVSDYQASKSATAKTDQLPLKKG